MVRRSPHIAIVVVSTISMQNGEYSGTDENTFNTITGRLDATSPTAIKDESGEYIKLTKVFYTNDSEIAGATHLVISGKRYRIVYWNPLQSHSEIWLD